MRMCIVQLINNRHIKEMCIACRCVFTYRFYIILYRHIIRVPIVYRYCPNYVKNITRYNIKILLDRVIAFNRISNISYMNKQSCVSKIYAR